MDPIEMWLTPPKLPPLGIKLVSLEGGGDSPAQFFGVTEEGRPIYIRYRGGWISVHRGGLGASRDSEMHEIFSAQIGPPFDGGLMLEQACEILGLVLPGTRPVSPEVLAEGRRYYPIKDLSGAKTFWDTCVYMTEVGFLDVLEALRASGRPMLIFSYRDDAYRQIDNVLDARTHVFIGFDAKPEVAPTLDFEGSLEDWPDVFSCVLKVRLPILGWNWTAIHSTLPKNSSYDVSTAKMTYLSLTCPTEPGRRRTAAEDVVGTIQSRVAVEVDLFDVNTRAFFKQRVAWHSRDVHDWCLADSNRIISFSFETTESGQDEYFAMKPSRAAS